MKKPPNPFNVYKMTLPRMWSPPLEIITVIWSIVNALSCSTIHITMHWVARVNLLVRICVSPVADVFCNHDYTSIPIETLSEDKAMEELDEYIGARIPYVRDDEPMIIKVRSRYCDAMGNVVGAKDLNSILDTRLYNVEFPDGHYEQFSTNVLAEALYSNIDSDGYDVGFIDSIIDHRVDDNIATKKTSPLKNKSKRFPQ